MRASATTLRTHWSQLKATARPRAGGNRLSSAVPQPLRFVQVNAFADRAFAGNPAAVFLVPPATAGWSINDELMQNIAAEMKLSETAFVTPADVGGSFATSTRFLLRWFYLSICICMYIFIYIGVYMCVYTHA